MIEEFLPYLVTPFLPQPLRLQVDVGPSGCFSALSFQGSLRRFDAGGGVSVRTKDQDFSISRKLYIKTSYDDAFRESVSRTARLAFVAAELKTNLDKTMFQEASATAHDVKTAVAGSKYFLLCEWLDMAPISTGATDIDRVLIMRGKRINSNVREKFSTVQGRREARASFQTYLSTNPFRSSVLELFVAGILAVLNDEDPIEDDVLRRGFF